MGGKQAGGVLVALVGAVLVVAGVRGTLGDVWAALVKAPAKAAAAAKDVPTTIGPITKQPIKPPPGYPGTGLTA